MKARWFDESRTILGHYFAAYTRQIDRNRPRPTLSSAAPKPPKSHKPHKPKTEGLRVQPPTGQSTLKTTTFNLMLAEVVHDAINRGTTHNGLGNGLGNAICFWSDDVFALLCQIFAVF